ncbi:MAG: DUF2784 domain-containing protein [Deltaproteobacteria bacterium]|nr:DUF2784 domain-containing protein [Deltaproteobacteria bacterium]
MSYRLMADIVVVIHFAFTIFVLLGGILTIWWRKVVWLHIPAAVWAAFIEFAGWICPLTPLENRLRIKGGEAGYPGGFVEEYILPVIYPAGLTREIQIILGILVITVNLVIYWKVFHKAFSGKQFKVIPK